MTEPAHFPNSVPMRPQPENQSLFAIDEWSETPLPDGTVMARNPRNGKQATLPAEVVTAMSYCRYFRTLDEHVDALTEGQNAGPDRRNAIRSVIQSLHEKGMTISAREVCDRLAAPGTIERTEVKPIGVIITWHRPEALKRLLASMIRNIAPESLDQVIVMDDSRDLELIEKNRTITQAADQKATFQVHYFGDEEALGLLNQLVETLPVHEESIRFLVDRERWSDLWTCGLSRNYAQLVAAGHPVIVFDDDIVCEVHDAPVGPATIDLADYPRQAVFYPDQADWPPPAPEGQRDPVARHMRCLGLTLPEALAEFGIDKPDPELLHHAEVELVSRLQPESRVTVTECGSLGDPGCGNNQWLTRLSEESRNRLLQDSATLPLAMKIRNSWLGRRNYSFAPASNMSQIFGSDNQSFLPPYFPFSRIEDRLFGQTLSFIDPHSLVLDQPWATPHVPIPPRFWQPADNDFTLPTHFPGELVYPSGQMQAACPHDEPMARLEYLARYYIDLGSCSDQVLLERFVDDWNDRRAVQLLDLDRNLQESEGAPAFWLDYLHTAIDQITASRLGNLQVSDLRSNISDLCGHELLDFWRESWRNYGAAMRAWPEIRGAALHVLK